MPRIFSYLCIGKGMVEATTWPKTALKTQSMSQVGDLDDKDDASAIDDCHDSCSVE